AAIEDRHVLSAKEPGLDSDVDRRHAAADDRYSAPNRKGAQVLGLTEVCDILDGVADALRLLALGAERIDALKPHGEENRIIDLSKALERHLLAKLAPILDGDAADAENEAYFRLREVIDGLIGGNAIFIESAWLLLGLMDGDLMAVHRKAVRAGK